MLLAALLLLLPGAGVALGSPFVNGGSPPGVEFGTDCTLRQLAWEYGKKLAPQKGQYAELFDAMQLNRCNTTTSTPTTSTSTGTGKPGEGSWWPPTFGPETERNPIFVDPTAKGSDDGDGSIQKPFASIQKALSVARVQRAAATAAAAAAASAAAASAPEPRTLLLRAGTFFLTEPIELTPADSLIAIQNYRGEDVSISGGVLLDPSWQPLPSVHPAALVAKLPLLTKVPGLRLDRGRAIRARYPNIADPEQHSAIVPLDGWIRNRTKWVPPAPFDTAVEVNASAADWPAAGWPMNESGGVPPQETGAGGQGYYTMGLGGPCEEMWPQYGYACGVGGGPRGAGQHMHPSGLHYDGDILPNAPYANATGAVIHAWRPAHWFTVQFEVGAANKSALLFSRGGFQGSEGFSAAAEWFIENVREETDSELEYFWDPATKELLFIPNGTLARDAEFIATQTSVLFNVAGTSSKGTAPDLVSNVTIRGLRLRDTAQSYLDVHGLPSGGDWALPYVAGVVLNNTAGVVIDSNLFTRMDGIGVAILGRNDETAVSKNEFEHLGGSAIVLWGRTGDELDAAGDRKLPWSDHPNGPNGMELDCPRDTLVTKNIAHDLGLWQKQSSLVFQAISARSIITDNIAYNFPRAAINLNDGYCGGDLISGNLLANTCRESGDRK